MNEQLKDMIRVIDESDKFIKETNEWLDNL